MRKEKKISIFDYFYTNYLYLCGDLADMYGTFLDAEHRKRDDEKK